MIGHLNLLDGLFHGTAQLLTRNQIFQRHLIGLHFFISNDDGESHFFIVRVIQLLF